MISKAEAMKQARKLPGPPKPGVVLRGMGIEVACAWMELHGLDPARNVQGGARWELGVLVLKRGIDAPLPLPPPPMREHERYVEEGENDGRE